jgi:hypothetical protein
VTADGRDQVPVYAPKGRSARRVFWACVVGGTGYGVKVQDIHQAIPRSRWIVFAFFQAYDRELVGPEPVGKEGKGSFVVTVCEKPGHSALSENLVQAIVFRQVSELLLVSKL